MIVDLYVDGSYFKNKPHVTHGGIVILDSSKGSEIKSLRRVSTERQDFIKSNNVGGEIIAAMVGIMDASILCDGAESTIHVYYDYKGIEDWITGKWSAKAGCSILYTSSVQRVLELNNNVTLKFHKIAAHSGNKYNELADLIAKGMIPQDMLQYQVDSIMI